MKKYLLRILWLVTLVSGLSCTEQVELDTDQGTNFFPLGIGQSRLYKVEEINIIGSVADTSSYFLKEVIEDSLIHGTETTYLIYRYMTEDTTSEWRLDSVWSARKNAFQAIVSENNLPYVKITFPVKEGNTWDGNILNSLDELMYYYEQPNDILLNGTTFDSKRLMRVVLSDLPANLVVQDERSEVYALICL